MITRSMTITKMSPLLPQSKCLPHTFSFRSKSLLPSSTLPSTNRWHIYFQMPCILSETSPQASTATTVLDTEKPQLASLEAHSNLADADMHCSCAGAIGSPTETETILGAVLAKETLLTGEEAIKHATAAEAAAIAKAAANVCKDSRMMFAHYCSSKLDGRPAIVSSEQDTSQLSEIGLAGVEVGSTLAKNGLGKNCYPSKEADDMEQILEDLAVRSRIQTEREARRHKVAEKAAVKDTIESVFTTPKRRASLLQADDYNPLAPWDGFSRTRFLTRAEEHKLSQGVQVLRKIEKLREGLADGATFAELAAAAGIDEKTLRYRLEHGMRCKDKLIRSNLGLVVLIAKEYLGTGRDLRELVQIGSQGLVQTAERFDPRKGRFVNYAPWWIRVAIRKSMYEESSNSYIPPHLVSELKKVVAAKHRLYGKHGRPPSEAQVAKEAGLSMKSLQFLLLLPEVRTVDQKVLEEFPGPPSPSLPYHYQEEEEEKWDPYDDLSPEEQTRRRCLKRDLEKELDALKPREKQVMKLRFGIECEGPMTLQWIGDLMGVTRERVRQIEESAFKQLKEKMDYELFRQYQ